MKSTEFLTEDITEIKGFNPFAYHWAVYIIQTPGRIPGFYPLQKGDLIATVEIKNKLILWDPYHYGTPRKIGKFFTINSIEELSHLALTKVNYTQDDLKAAFLYIKWDAGNKTTRPQLASEFLSLTNLSPIFKKAPAILYRGLSLETEQIKMLKEGKSLSLSEQVASSWSMTKETAMVFTGRKGGVIIQKQFTANDIICNLEKLDQIFKLPLIERWGSENEVLIKGNGIGPMIDPHKLKLSFGKMTSDGDFTEL